MKLKILVVDDNQDVIHALVLLLKTAGYETIGLATPEILEQEIKRVWPDLIILDMNFTRDTTGGDEGIRLLKKIKGLGPKVPVIMITAWGTIDKAVESLKNGASDYMVKPWENEKMLTTVKNLLDLKSADQRVDQLTEENRALRAEIQDSFEWGEIVGTSPQILGILNTVATVAKSEASVLISGENGTGKELIAKAIHINSRRKERPFIRVNVGAIPENLFESEMFGHVKGAFTDAKEKREGRFHLAHDGTLFLDEIANISLNSQAKLLRVLQEGEFEPVGSDKTIKVDVRILSATNQNLKEIIGKGLFREDLFYRLNVINLHIPPLRERTEDISPLAEKFLEKFNRKNHKNILGISPAAMSLLTRYTWPGNIRELENMIERAVILCQGQEIAADHLPSDLLLTLKNKDISAISQAEATLIQKALLEAQGNISLAAKALGLSRGALYRRLEKYGIEMESIGGNAKG